MISYKYKYVGMILFLTGVTLTVLYMIHRMSLKVPVLAVYSSYIRSRFFTVITTNIFEEITMICFLAGSLLTVFSKERNERKEYSMVRSESWKMAVLINSAFLAFSILFIYGRGFAAVLIANLFSIFIIYYIVFLVKKARID